MDIIVTLIAGAVATTILTLIIKNTYKIGLNPKEWDVLENGVAPLMDISKKRVYTMHILAEVIVFPLFFKFTLIDSLKITKFNEVMIVATIFAFCIFVLAAIVPILKAPDGYKLKSTFSLLLGRMAYGVSLGIVLAAFKIL